MTNHIWEFQLKTIKHILQFSLVEMTYFIFVLS
jgi:hypothetical protein